MPPVKGALTKDTPSAPQAATAAWLDQIAKCQREQPTLTYQQASDLAYLENRHLYQLAVEEQRWPQPSLPAVGKQAEMADETIHKMVDAALAQDSDQSTMQAWQQVLKNHEGQPTFGPIYKRYRRWVLSDGLEAHDVAALAKARARK